MPEVIQSHSIKNELKATLSLGVPLTLAQIVYACSGFLGTAFVARLGQDALAASVLVSTIWYSFTVFFLGILNATSILVAHQHGAKNYTAISEIMRHSFLLGAIIIVVLMLSLFCVPYFLSYTPQSANVLKLAQDYLLAWLWSVPGLIILIIYEQFFAGTNRAKLVLRISLSIVPIEIPLIYALIFGKFGLPACGIAGVGYGFAVTYTLTTIVLTLYLIFSKQYQKYQLFRGIKAYHWHWLKELIHTGLPMGIMHVIEVSSFAVVTIWMAQFGTTLLAAHQIIFQYLGFAITLVFAMSQAVTVRVGHAVGRQDLSGIHYAIYVGMCFNFICMLAIAFAFYAAPHFFLSLDVNVHAVQNQLLVNAASMLLAICGVLMLFDNFRIIGFGALRGLKDTKFPMYSSFIAFWFIGLGSAYLFAFHFHGQAEGIWWGLTFGIACGALMVLARLKYLLKRIDLKHLASLTAIPEDFR